MSKENVVKFYEALKADKNLAEEFKKAAASANLDSPEKAANLTVKFAAEKGYPFSADNLKAFESEARELSPEELNNVNAAGSIDYGGGCVLLGIGMGKGTGFGATACFVLGVGLGGWNNPDPK